MSKHLFLAAAASLAVLSSPVAAQSTHSDSRYGAAQQAGTYDGEWEGGWEDEETYSGEWEGSYADQDGRVIDAEYEGTWNEGPSHEEDRGPGHHGHMRHSGPRFAYSAAQREEWLEQCRALRGENREYIVYEDEDEGDDGGLIGGLLGAIVGGIAGNRIADGERLGGTLIGAGVGGLAGLVIGSAIDRANDRDDRDNISYIEDDNAFGYCEAYLLNYERGYGPGYGQSGQITYAPVIMMPVGQMQRQAPQRRMIHREVIVEHAEPRHTHQPAPAPRQHVTRRPSAPAGKVQPIN